MQNSNTPNLNNIPRKTSTSRRGNGTTMRRQSELKEGKHGNRKTSMLTELKEGSGIDKAQIEPQSFATIPGQIRFEIEHRPGDAYKSGMIQIFAQNWWTKREYRAVYGDADAIRIMRKPLKVMYQLLTKALAGESQSASVQCSLAGGEGNTSTDLRLTIVVTGEFDVSTHEFKLIDVTSTADSNRLQDMILDLRQDYMRLTERVSDLEKSNAEVWEKNAALENTVLQLQRQLSILMGDHEQHMLILQNGFKVANEQVYGAVFARREGRRCVFNGLVSGSSARGDHEGTVMLMLPDTLWPPHRLIFNGTYCTAEGHFCHFSIHVCPNGQEFNLNKWMIILGSLIGNMGVSFEENDASIKIIHQFALTICWEDGCHGNYIKKASRLAVRNKYII